MDVCETKNMDLFNKVPIFEPMKVHTFEPNIMQNPDYYIMRLPYEEQHLQLYGSTLGFLPVMVEKLMLLCPQGSYPL